MEGRKLLMTLLEGHATVYIKTEGDKIVDVLYQGVDVRFFETFWVGNLVDEMPRITPMICGVCSATHHVCSAKAVDMVRGVEPPETAIRIRDAMNYGLHLNNQAMHLVALGLPDFLPPDTPRRSLIQLSKARPELVKTGLELVELGFQVVKVFGGRDVHPINAIAGGVARPPNKSDVEKLAALFREKEATLKRFVEEAWSLLQENHSKIEKYKPSYKYMMAIDPGKPPYNPSHGTVKIIDEKGGVKTTFPDKGPEYLHALDEHTVDYSYIKMVTPKGGDLRSDSIMVGALARLNIVTDYGVEWANELRDKIFEEWGKPARHTLLTHYARIVETVALYEILKEKLASEDYYTPPHANPPTRGGGEGAGIVEAPRGLLIHHYAADEASRTVFVNIITPTAINAAAIEADLRNHLVGKTLTELGDKLYAEVAAIVRAYDPCMSCSTHTALQPAPITIRIVDANTPIKLPLKPPRRR
ncbi:MAG: Ni/Fe hydrogenase subunit alpha [Crenarchaeota archaeon]|nr:Ni/Fe hydrogenase subunit alpha [Thermoproteota archaeon]